MQQDNDGLLHEEVELLVQRSQPANRGALIDARTAGRKRVKEAWDHGARKIWTSYVVNSGALLWHALTHGVFDPSLCLQEG